jgi:hypothetical protein
MSSIFSYFTAKMAIEASEVEASARIDETRHDVAIGVRSKLGEFLNKVSGVLQSARQASSRLKALKPVDRGLERISNRIQEAQGTNAEKIETQRESHAWATMRRILARCVRKKAVDTTIAVETVSLLPSSRPALNLFAPLGNLSNITLPSWLKFSAPAFETPLGIPSVNLDGIASIDIPQMRLETSIVMPEMPQIKLPDLSFLRDPPSIVQKIAEPVIKKMTDIAIDKEMDALERAIEDPIKETEAQVTARIEGRFGPEGREFLEATRVVVDHHTKGCREKVNGCWHAALGGIRTRLTSVHRYFYS